MFAGARVAALVLVLVGLCVQLPYSQPATAAAADADGCRPLCGPHQPRQLHPHQQQDHAGAPPAPGLPAVVAPVVQALETMAATNSSFQCQLCQALLQTAGATAAFGFNLSSPAELYAFLDAFLLAPPTAPSPYVHAFDTIWSGRVGFSLVRGAFMRQWMRRFVEARGVYFDSPASVPAIGRWIAEFQVNTSEYTTPPGGWPSFNAWFARRLHPDARPTASPGNASLLTSPVDGFCSAVALAGAGHPPPVVFKGEAFALDEVFGNASWAAYFAGSTLVTCSVYPYFYHWVRAPATGQIVYQYATGGLYFGADELADKYAERRRNVYVLDAPGLGYVGLAVVAAYTVGSINIAPGLGANVTKGDELGYFKFGGSTVGLFLPRGARTLAPAYNASTLFHAGQPMAFVPAPKPGSEGREVKK